jgi:hypothetical protein
VPMSWLSVLNRFDGHKYESGSSSRKQHQWLLCQVLAESKPNSNLLSWSICLICHFPEC